MNRFAIGCVGFGLGADCAFEDLYGGAAYAWREFFAVLRDFHFDFAGAAHFDALGDVQGVASTEISVLDEIRA